MGPVRRPVLSTGTKGGVEITHSHIESTVDMEGNGMKMELDGHEKTQIEINRARAGRAKKPSGNSVSDARAEELMQVAVGGQIADDGAYFDDGSKPSKGKRRAKKAVENQGEEETIEVEEESANPQDHIYELFYEIKGPVPGVAYSNMTASCRVTSRNYEYACSTAMSTALKNFAELDFWVRNYTWEQILEMCSQQGGEQDAQEQE